MRLPLRMMLGGLALVAVAAAGALALPRSSQADIVSGEYSLQADITATSVTTGNTFVVDVSIDDTITAGYQAVQWHLEYDETLVAPGSLVIGTIRDAAAPANCGNAQDNGSRLLLGCIDIFGPNLTYSGDVWHITFTCVNPGTAVFTLGTLNTQSFVRISVTNQPAHLHGDSVDCTGVALPTSTPTNTPTSPPSTSTPTVTPTATVPLTAPSASPTRAPREPFTETPEPTNTPTPGTPGEEPTTGPGGPGTVASPTRTGSGGPGGVLRPPDTGSGPQDGASTLLLVIFGAMGAAGIALFGAGAAAARRAR